jgi:hypothetical protein
MQNSTELLDKYKDVTQKTLDLLLADLVMIGEIPAPTFAEAARAKFIGQRLTEAGLVQCSVDEKDNAFGILPGTQGQGRCILVASNCDTLPIQAKDQVIEMRTDRLIGPFVGDNSIALATLCFLPGLLELLQIRLKSDLILLASSRALGRGNLEGLKHFLSNCPRTIQSGLCLESIQLGRLNYECIGLLQGEIHCRLPDDYKWVQYGATGTIIPMADVINRISAIPLPRRPLTTIIMGSMTAGISYNNIAREAVLRFEVRSESSDILRQLKGQIEDIVVEGGARSGTKFTVDFFAQREPRGLEISHPLVRQARTILSALGIEPMLYSTTSQLVAMHDSGIPGITVGITIGERHNELDEVEESAALALLPTGIAQLVALLTSMDQEVSP